ncbi:MAG: response regulator [Sphingobacteriales bacterium]|nr:MAG: response regulator [Sphingobacteriales bacterium]
MEKKILYLDDDPAALFILETILSGEGYSVKPVRTSDLFFPLIKSFNPDLIILDIKLEDGDGRQICNDLKNDDATRHIPVILITALSYEEISEVECNADAILGKSLDSGNLLKTIADLI